jgi:hypothetical protein
MAEQKRFPWLALILGIGILCVLCLCVLVVGGGAAYLLASNSEPSSSPELAAGVTVEPVPSPSPVDTLEPTTATPPEPTLAEPTLTVPAPTEPASLEPSPTTLALTGGQRLEEYSFFDDFSSNALGWPTASDGSIVLGYENQAYSFQIVESDYYDWAYFPVDFIPYEFSFDVQGPPGTQDGTFGVFCQYQDADNYYYVEFDLADNTYLIGQYLDDEYIRLSEQSSTTGQDWLSTGALNSSPSVPNHIAIGCYLDTITLFINDQWVDQVNVNQPFDHPADAAFFVYTFDFADEDGYKVIFDNVEIWQPVQ